MAKDTIVVYWGVLTAPDRQTLTNLIWQPPVSLISTLPKTPTDSRASYRSCKSSVPIFKRTFALLNHRSVYFKYTGEGLDSTEYETDFDAWIPEPSPMAGCRRVDYDYSWFFFCEEPLIMRQYPPYLHNTSAGKTAYVPTGEFDISKWFRSVNPTFILWEGQTEIQLTENEPLFYMEFMTDKKVILKQFEANDEIRTLGRETGRLKQVFPMLELTDLYNRFTRSNRHKRLLKLIKENLLY